MTVPVPRELIIDGSMISDQDSQAGKLEQLVAPQLLPPPNLENVFSSSTLSTLQGFLPNLSAISNAFHLCAILDSARCS